ncbi:hypothetical protein [Porphyrobacter sp. CACIAM 03H1]|uniref:hypothetical protein n=1 Tax=Porphyrobacter sp. CACIAM 03H1 TaxID=2003315 RepID=UPI000B5A23BF|nr:hypothetical protein [Porphyrobacter sp. CACIAM 03H1]ASJ92184.1 hypothetical protein CBR61_15445 [Porphyrobacter sp. CACIAM 03H1]
MKTLAKLIGCGIAAGSLALAAPAYAQPAEVYKDYTPADEVIEMTLVKVDEGHADTYLGGLRKTWIAANEIQKKLGHIKDYAIYGVPYGDGEFNVVLIVVFPNTEALGPSKERYMAFLEAYGKANIDAGNKTQIELYNKIREIQGTYLLRKVNFAN